MIKLGLRVVCSGLMTLSCATSTSEGEEADSGRAGPQPESDEGSSSTEEVTCARDRDCDEEEHCVEHRCEALPQTDDDDDADDDTTSVSDDDVLSDASVGDDDTGDDDTTTDDDFIPDASVGDDDAGDDTTADDDVAWDASVGDDDADDDTSGDNDAGNASVDCAAGSWDHDQDPATACVDWTTCLAGTRVSDEGSATQDRACAPCEAGTFSTGVNQSACEPAAACAAGMEQTAPGTPTSPPSCTPCAAGDYCPGGTATAEDCAAGFWDHDQNPATACIDKTTCLGGTRVNDEGSTTTDRSCATCDAGTYSAESNADACTPCDAGTFSASNATECSSWIECVAGQYVSQAGSATSNRQCSACGPGRFSATSNATECSPWRQCDAGQYVSQAGSAMSDRQCNKCNPGTFSTGINQSVCQPAGACAAGTVQTAPATPTSPPSCAPCAAGNHCPGGTAPAEECAAGSWDDDQDPATACIDKTTCLGGTRVNDEGSTTTDRSCATCDAGTYSAEANADTCTPCAAGTYSAANNATSCTPWSECPQGHATDVEGTAIDDRTCKDVRWASWPMPNPPSSGLPNPASYTVDEAAGVVTDNVTGLMWQRAVDSFGNWGSAKTYCAGLSLAGHDDWRLPTRIELVSLVDFTRSAPAIDTDAFPGTLPDGFWTSSLFASSTAWYVEFYDGATNYADGVYTFFLARCVR